MERQQASALPTISRDLYPEWMNPKAALQVHKFSAAIIQLRDADQIKDLGALYLSR